MIVYRRIRKADAQIRGQDPAAYLKSICERIQGGLANAGIVASRMGGQEIRNWLIRWFNPHPDHLGKTEELVDALGSGPSGGNTVEVRVFSWAPYFRQSRSLDRFCFSSSATTRH